ncbi:MAG: tetratricopeptide repeat protein [Aggregatilineaceae bacterium]
MMLSRALLIAALALGLSLNLAAAPLPGVMFDDYRISYEALLANGDVENAYRLAHDIVQRYPKDRDWQRRLARVAVWTGRSAEAYAAWKGLYRAGLRDREVENEVFRLATHFNDTPILIELWHTRHGARDISEADAEHLAALYERDRPMDGARYFEQEYRKQGHHWLGFQAARLYELAGHDDDAIRIYRTLLKSEPSNSGWLLAAARLEIRRNRLRAALDLLKTHQTYMANDAFEYWQMLGDLAWLHQDDSTAVAAYRRAAAAPIAGKLERGRLISLLLQDEPFQAADLCLRYYRDSGDAAWLLWALEIYIAHNAWNEAREALDLAKDEAQQKLLQNPRFLQLRAHINQHVGDMRSALADIRQALKLAPEDDAIRVDAIWLFLAAGEHTALEAMIAEAKAKTADPRYLQALAVAAHTLGRYQEAGAYYRLLLKQTPDQPVLLLSYADLLQSTGQTGLAARLRQRAWQLLHKDTTADSDDERFLARVRTELANEPGDGAARRVRRLLAQSASFTAARVRQLDEVLLVWALDSGQLANVEAWVRQHYGPNRPLPLWVELRLALETRDRETLQRLLDTQSDKLPASGAHEAAMLIGDWPRAWQYAFNGAQRHPDDDELHQRLVETIDLYGDYAEAIWQQTSYSDFDSRRWRLRVDQALSARWRLAAEVYEAIQTLRPSTLLHQLPGEDMGCALEVIWGMPQQRWCLALEGHRELTDYTGWRMNHHRELGHRLQLDLLVGSHQPSEHSTALQVAGHADRVQAGLHWAVTRRVYLATQLGSERYHTQHGAYLGSGSQVIWETGYRIRSEYPDWNIRAYGAHYRYRADGAPDDASLQLFTAQALADTPTAQHAGLFVPRDNDYYALCTGAGQYLRWRYSRALRPYTDVCAVHSTEGGMGYSLLVGLSGSLVGEDQLTVTWEHSHAARQTGSRDLSIITLIYRLYF